MFWRGTFDQEVQKNLFVGISGNSQTIGLHGAIKEWEIGKIKTVFHLGFAYPISNKVIKNYTPVQLQVTVSPR